MSDHLYARKGDILFSKKLQKWVVFDSDEAGDYFYDPVVSNTDEGPHTWTPADLGLNSTDYDAVARQVHLDAAVESCNRYADAINAAWAAHFDNRVAPFNSDYREGYLAALRAIGNHMAVRCG